jgi:Flp pilus assembly protein TadG
VKSDRRQRGETTVQVVLLVPVVLLLLLVGVHFASYMHASNVANSASKRGAQIAAGMPDSHQASLVASSSVSEMVNALGSRLNRATDTVVSPNFVSVSVQLRIARILPFLPDTVTRRGMARREIFMTEGQR